MSTMRTCLALTGAIAAGLTCMTASAVEVSYSGYGTVGYAQSDQSYNYQRYINRNGTFERDSIFGAQADVKFSEQWGATVQAKLAPSITRDNRWDASLSWAFLSYRPSNDLLVRVGKQRVPLYLYSENMDVGVTYDFARLPGEMYSIAPTTDYVGAAFDKTWSRDIGEFTLDGYVGKINSNWRFYQRDNVNITGSQTKPGSNFQGFSMDGMGMVLTWVQDENKYRIGAHRISVDTKPGEYFPANMSLVPASAINASLAPYISGTTYTLLPSDKITRIESMVYTLGAEVHLPQNFMMIGEYGRRQVKNAVTGVDTTGGYLSLLKQVDAWTPYVSYARIRSNGNALSLYQAVNANSNGLTDLTGGFNSTVAGTVQTLNASQRVLADALSVFDQRTISLGVSYRVTPTQKIKAEWARTHVGIASTFVDAPSGSNVSDRNIDVLSLSYNFAF